MKVQCQIIKYAGSMVTRDAIKGVLEYVSKDEMLKVLESEHDYITLEVNGYGHVTISSEDYDIENEELITGEGNIYTDKATFHILIEEVLGSNYLT